MRLDSRKKAVFDALLFSPTEDAISRLSSLDFSLFIAYLYLLDGTYSPIWVDGAQDGGIAIEVWSRNRPGRDLIEVVQCLPSPRRPVSRQEVQSFLAAMKRSRVTRGKFFTVAGFAPGARDLARSQQPRVLLEDGETILDWIERLQFTTSTASSDAFSLAALSSVEIPQFHEISPTDQPLPELSELVKSSIPIICIANNKGGIGKTTATGNIAGMLAHLGHRILLIDLDGQSNLTSWLSNLRDVSPDASSFALFSHEVPLSALIRPTLEEGISLIPASSSLDEIPYADNQYLVTQRLAQSLNRFIQSRPPFDYILIDTPPALNSLTRAALLTSQFLLIPFDLDNFSYEGVQRLLLFVSDTETRYQLAPLTILGGIAMREPTQGHDRVLQAEFAKQIARAATEHPRINGRGITSATFWCGTLREREDFRRAKNQRKTVASFAPRSDASKEIRSLTQEVIRRVGQSNP